MRLIKEISNYIKFLNMKKSITILFLFALTFSFTAIEAQDISEAQRLERCQNNKNRLAGLEKQLQITNAELSQAWSDKEIENARDKIIRIRFIKKYYTEFEGGIKELELIQAQYNPAANYCFSLPELLKLDAINNCINELEKTIFKKIDKAMALKSKRPQLINNKRSIEKQISNHRTNLIALRCDAASVNTNLDCKTPSVIGTYKMELDKYPAGVLKIESQSGNEVIGKYGDEKQPKNIISGKFSEGRDCKVLEGTFTNKDYNSIGGFKFTFSSDGSSFSGTWWHSDKSRSGSWTGTRK